MTVLVSVKINDGAVMAADSAGSFAGAMLYHNPDKFVNIRARPCRFGTASIRRGTI